MDVSGAPSPATGRRRRSSSTASCTSRSGRTTSSRSTPRPAGCSGSIAQHARPTQMACCGANNRGLAILGDTLFMGTLDAQAGRASTPRPAGHAGRSRSPSGKSGYSMTHGAARRQGQGDRRRRRRRDTASAASSPPTTPQTGKEAWRFYTIPGPGEPGHETWEACPPNPKTYLRSRGVEARRRLDVADRLVRSATRT